MTDLAQTTVRSHVRPEIRRITHHDVRRALEKGVDDFREMPTHGLYLGVVYAVLGLIAAWTAFNYDLATLIYPLSAGFALLGPFAAIGVYELSRRRERGLESQWWHMFGVLRSASIGSILILGITLMLIFLLWLNVAHAIFIATFGREPVTAGQFARELFTTGHGWALIVIGNLVGAVFAIFVFLISVVSFPLLIDRPIGVDAAIGTSTSAVVHNPGPMLLWAAIIAVSLLVASLPLLLGLVVVLPVLGHATWHLYRAVIAP
jgi:uncharacterized membrane protein